MDSSTLAISEHDCNVLGGLFQLIIADLKGGHGTWDDFLVKATKFHSQMKATIASSTAFLDSFQKVADMATSARGGTKEIGTALTRMCLRHRSVEAKMKSFTSALLDCLISPLQERIDDWKKTQVALDKEHTKEIKRLRQEMKKRGSHGHHVSHHGHHGPGHGVSSNHHHQPHHQRRQVKYDSGIYGTIGLKNSSLSRSLDAEALQEIVSERLMLVEELEKKAVKRALVEERSHFCFFVKFLTPVVEEEIAMITEISHLQEIMEQLHKLTQKPLDLPVSSELVISGMKINKHDSSAWSTLGASPPSSPSSLGSRKSSMCSISSVNSSSSSSTYGQLANANRYLSLTNIPTASQPIYGTEIEIGIPIKPEVDNTLQFHLEPETHDYMVRPKTPNTNPFLDDYEPPPEVPANSHTSEGSITPTNLDSDSVFGVEPIYGVSSSSTSGSRRPSRSGKTPPPAPVRRTSSISNPNAITIGTLKSHYGNLDDFKNKPTNISLYDEIGVLTKSMNDINNSLKNTDFSGSNTPVQNKSTPQQEMRRDSLKNMFDNYQHPGPGLMSKTASQDEPLPAPPPEAYVEANNHSNNMAHSLHQQQHQQFLHNLNNTATNAQPHHFNKISSVHREFMEQLNSKLAHPTPIHEKSVTTAVVKPRRSQSSSRSGSRKSSQDKGLTSNFLDRLQATLSQKQTHGPSAVNEIAKQAATAASQLQRKQSVPDLNESNYHQAYNHHPGHHQNGGLKQRQYNSQLNLSETDSGSANNGGFQVVQIHTNSTQQPIYASRAQLRRDIQDLYGTIGTSTYGTSAPDRDPNYYNNGGFWNKI